MKLDEHITEVEIVVRFKDFDIWLHHFSMYLFLTSSVFVKSDSSLSCLKKDLSSFFVKSLMMITAIMSTNGYRVNLVIILGCDD